jgi:hypothetical protein
MQAGMAVRASILRGFPAALVRRVRPLRAALRRTRAGLRLAYVTWLRLRGAAATQRALQRCTPGLRADGARIGAGTAIHGPLHLMNAPRELTGLEIGADAYLGPDLLIDLTAPVRIGDRVAISARCSLVTQVRPEVGIGSDLEARQLTRRVHQMERAVDRRARADAGAVVRDVIPEDAVAAGQPARVVKQLAAEVAGA